MSIVDADIWVDHLRSAEPMSLEILGAQRQRVRPSGPRQRPAHLTNP